MPLITPPFRTSLLTANGAPFATDNGDIQTTKDWWLYWNQLTDRSNSNSKLVNAGTHGDRPMPESMPDGALYYENDRGVLYANTLGVWQYVAGTMFGTLSPDERPTDLGTHDAGFDFRTIVAPAREFLWSQAEWIEVTPVQYGPHSARPNPATIVQGALYVESDRGGVIYQVENPAGTPLWQYLTGIMYGTLVPDQRPAGLGTHDAGFTFRTLVAPAREFIWNQTAWVESAAPVPGLVQYAAASSTLTLTTAPTTIPGLSLALPRMGQWLITGCIDFTTATGTAGDAGQFLAGRLANAAGTQIGSAQSYQYPVVIDGGPARLITTQQWVYVTNTTTDTANLQAWKSGGTGGAATQTFSTLSALWVSPT